jgi:large subunit ribosomal protein L29
MKAEDLKTKTEDELMKLLLDTRKEQFNMRFQKTNGSLDNTADVRKKRRLVARIKTFLNAKKLGLSVAAKNPAKAAKKPAATKAKAETQDKAKAKPKAKAKAKVA